MKIVPDTLLADGFLNKLLVDLLKDLQLERQRLTVVEETPSALTEEPTVIYNRSTKTLLICDTQEWRQVATEPA